LTPLGKGDGAVELEGTAAVKMTFLIEMVVDRSVDRNEFLLKLDNNPVGRAIRPVVLGRMTHRHPMNRIDGLPPWNRKASNVET
jgi:hypothetical protein